MSWLAILGLIGLGAALAVVGLYVIVLLVVLKAALGAWR